MAPAILSHGSWDPSVVVLHGASLGVSTTSGTSMARSYWIDCLYLGLDPISSLFTMHQVCNLHRPHHLMLVVLIVCQALF